MLPEVIEFSLLSKRFKVLLPNDQVVMKINTESFPLTEAISKGIGEWDIWEIETSLFPWYYGEKEACYILEGEATIITSENSVYLKAGDYVEFPKGLACHWEVHKTIRKHYNFI